MNAETNTQRDELAQVAAGAFYVGRNNLRLMTAALRLAWFRVADAILAAGYRKPRTLGYIVVGLSGRLMAGGEQFLTRDAAQSAADDENADLGGASFYRVAEIVEAAE